MTTQVQRTPRGLHVRVVSLFSRSFFGFVETIIRNLTGPIGDCLRYYYWRCRMRHVGSSVTFGVGLRIANPQFISIGDNTHIDDGVTLLAGPPNASRTYHSRRANHGIPVEEGVLAIGCGSHVCSDALLQAHGGMNVGNYVGVASGARLYSLSHHYRDISGRAPTTVMFKFSNRSPEGEQALISSPVVLQDNSAVGTNSVVLPGVTIGAGAWVGALSLVVKDVPDRMLALGVPATVIKELEAGECE